jgi:hypothetical protein
MNELMKLHGYYTAKDFNRRLKEFMKAKKSTRSESTNLSLRRDVE